MVIFQYIASETTMIFYTFAQWSHLMVFLNCSSSYLAWFMQKFNIVIYLIWSNSSIPVDITWSMVWKSLLYFHCLTKLFPKMFISHPLQLELWSYNVLYSEAIRSPWLFWRAEVAQWWEHSPPTSMAPVRFPVSAYYVGWVGCFSTLLWVVFSRYSGFPLSSKTNL